MTTITATTKVWATTYSSIGPNEIINPSPTIVDRVAYTNQDMSDQGWTFLGDATITIEFVDKEKLISNKVDALRSEAANIRAEATAKCTKIESQINQLLCLENSPTIQEEDDGSIPF